MKYIFLIFLFVSSSLYSEDAIEAVDIDKFNPIVNWAQLTDDLIKPILNEHNFISFATF